ARDRQHARSALPPPAATRAPPRRHPAGGRDRGDPAARVAGAGSLPNRARGGRGRRRAHPGRRARAGPLRPGQPRRVRVRRPGQLPAGTRGALAPPRVREGDPLLHRRAARAARAAGCASRAARAAAESAAGTDAGCPRAALLRARVLLLPGRVGSGVSRVVVLTGAAGAIGRVLATALAEAGYALAAFDLD